MSNTKPALRARIDVLSIGFRATKKLRCNFLFQKCDTFLAFAIDDDVYNSLGANFSKYNQQPFNIVHSAIENLCYYAKIYK